MFITVTSVPCTDTAYVQYVNIGKASQVSFYLYAQQFACITHQELVNSVWQKWLRCSQDNVPAGLACHMTKVISIENPETQGHISYLNT